MAQAIDIRRPEGQLTRAGLLVKDITDSWRRQARGDRFIEALLTFLNTRISNKNTRRSYSFAITEFWGWYQQLHRHAPTPDKIRRSDAFAFAEYLQERTIGLDAFRLKQDADRTFDLAIYEYVLDHPGTRIDDIRKHLLRRAAFTTMARFEVGGRMRTLTVLKLEEHEPRGDALDDYVDQHGHPPPNPLDLRLACLVEHKLLKRTPTVSEIRAGVVDLDIDDQHRAQLDFRVDPQTFSYYIDTHTQTGTARVTTVALRLTALSSFWRFLIDTGENQGDDQPLLTHNVWSAPLAQVQRRVPARKQVARELTTPSLELVARVLATAYSKSHGPDQAFEAAMTAAEGGDPDRAAIADPSIYDLRDRAIILFALLIGARAEEMTTVRKSDMQPGSPPIVELRGKGGKSRLVGVPEPVMRALQAFYTRLEELAADADPRARIHTLLQPDAPLLPALKLWGRNERDVADASDMSGLSMSGFQMMLRRRARRAGIDKEDPEMDRIHPHGIRHLAALLAVDRDQPLPVIQATLGHASLSVTGQYVEQRDPSRRLLIDRPGDSRKRRTLETEREIIEAEPEDVEIEEEIDLEQDDEDAEPFEVAEPYDEYVDERQTAEDLAEQEPAEQEPEDEEGLIAIGDAPEAPLISPSDRAIILSQESEAVSRMLKIYENQWGQVGQRSKLVPRGRGVLAHTYVGRDSGLGWWQGPKGEMKDDDFSYVPNEAEFEFPAMPVISPGQFIGGAGDPTCEQPLCVGLSELWERWYHDEEAYGPTAAMALTAWIRTAARVTLEVDDVVRSRRGFWAEFEAPLGLTRSEGGSSPRALREHLDGAIVAWFEASAWQYRPSQYAREPIGAELPVVGWYAKTDPLADIPTREREELFDWLRVFTGLPPKDREPRLGGVTRKEAGEFISAVCQYEMIEADDDLGFQFGIDQEMKDQSLDVLNDKIRKTVAQITRGRIANFDYRQRRKQRKIDKTRQEMAREAATRTESVDEQQETLRAMYSKYLAPYIMALVGELFGPAAGEDPLLQMFSLCTAGAPLKRAGEKYKSMFRIVGDTIEHTPTFAREFARETGAHSECVARRLARHIYEEGRAEQWAKRRNWPETIAYLDAMSAYHVPCPGSMERELADRLGVDDPLPVFEAWRDAQRRLQAAAVADDEGSDVAEVMREAQEREVARPKRAPRAFEAMTRNPNRLTNTRSALSYVPNSALIAIWTNAMRAR